MTVWTSRCCAPSCRSRTTRRRSSSVAATIRARDAASSARASVFEIAVATSSVNSASRSSMPVGQRLALRDAGDHRAPDLAVDDDRGAGADADPGLARIASAIVPRIFAEVLDPRRSAGLREQSRRSVRSSSGQLRAGLERMRRSPQAPTTVAVPSGS